MPVRAQWIGVPYAAVLIYKTARRDEPLAQPWEPYGSGQMNRSYTTCADERSR